MAEHNHPNDLRIFRYGDLGIRVISEPFHLNWLEEFFRPCFKVEKIDHLYDWQVTLDLNDSSYKRTLSCGEHSDRELATNFALDSHEIRLPRWQSDSAHKVFFDPSYEVFYRFSPDCHKICILSRNGNIATRTALMRIVREVAMTHIERRGMLLAHGAFFVEKDRGILIAGPKMAGKSTLLVHLLRNSQVFFVSNDRTAVDIRESEIYLRGIPTIVSLRASTMRFFPDLYQKLKNRRYHHWFSLSESMPSHMFEDWRKRETPDLTPAQFRRLVGAEACASAKAFAVLFPKVTNTIHSLRLSGLSGERAADRFRDALFRAHLPRPDDYIFSDGFFYSHPMKLRQILSDFVTRSIWI